MINLHEFSVIEHLEDKIIKLDKQYYITYFFNKDLKNSVIIFM